MRNTINLVSKHKLFILSLIILCVVIIISAFIKTDVFLSGNVLEDKIIVIDAGHGGVDSGANNSYILEKDINLDVALKLQKRLEASGAKVIMTRTEDVELSRIKKFNRTRYLADLTYRLNIINNSSAHMFISIHANSNKSRPSTRGAMAFYYKCHPHNREIAYALQNIFNNYEFEYQGRRYKSSHTPQIGKYYLLVNSKIPGVIVETGFITNSTDLTLLKKAEYREHIADAILQGISSYFLNIDSMPEKIDETLYIEEEHTIDMSKEDMGGWD